MSAMFARAIAEVSEANVSLKRLQKFLDQEECSEHYKHNIIQNEIKHAVHIENCKIKQNNDDKDTILKIKKLKIAKGKLVVVVGCVGSGKVFYESNFFELS